MKGFLRRLTGQKTEKTEMPGVAPPAAAPPPDSTPDVVAPAQPASTTPPQPVAATPAAAAAGGGDVPGPVFSSRAVRDATVVTGAIETLGRFVVGQDVTGDLIHRLEALTPDQVNFLQLSAEPGLIQRALVRAEGQKGTKAAALRKLLGDIAGGAIPDAGKSNPLLVPREPILPPLASLKHKQGIVGAPAEPQPAASSPLPASPPVAVGPTQAPVAPPLSPPRPVSFAQPVAPVAHVPGASVAAAVAAAPLPPRPRAAPSAPPPREPEVKPVMDSAPPPAIEPVTLSPIITSSAVEAPPPVPAPPPTVASADFAALPRLARADAESRRARLMAALNDHLSANEAAP
jgi:hypothetical protein